MPVQCNQGWLADLRLCGPFSRRWRSFFIDTGTGGIAFPLQQPSFIPDTMRYYWFWIEMLILGTGQLGLRVCPAHFSFFTWLRRSVSVGSVNPKLTMCCSTLVQLGKDWGPNAACQSFQHLNLTGCWTELHHTSAERLVVRGETCKTPVHT